MRWIIGDIHGMLRPLEALLTAIRRRDAAATFFFCGDYCDRGPDPRGVVDLVLALQADGLARCVRGNHDDVFDLCVNRHSLASGETAGGEVFADDVSHAVRLFWREGILETMSSYGIDLEAMESLEPDVLAEAFAEVPESHRVFFRELPAIVETEDFFVVHATWPPDRPDTPTDQLNQVFANDSFLRYDAIWGRYGVNQILSPKTWTRTAYVGHTPTETYLGKQGLIRRPGDVIFGESVVLTDTACFTPAGRLSAVCHETGEVVQVRHGGQRVG
jgi:serine/threonine protein phosphatase 1